MNATYFAAHIIPCRGRRVRIEFVINPELQRKFEAKKQEFKQKNIPDTIIYAFHGTGKENVKSICQNNLNVISRCVYGYGYYLSEYPDISQSYGAGLLMFKVLPGNEYLGTDHYSHYGPNAQYQSKKLTSYEPYGIKQMDLLYRMSVLPHYVVNLIKGYHLDHTKKNLDYKILLFHHRYN